MVFRGRARPGSDKFPAEITPTARGGPGRELAGRFSRVSRRAGGRGHRGRCREAPGPPRRAAAAAGLAWGVTSASLFLPSYSNFLTHSF